MSSQPETLIDLMTKFPSPIDPKRPALSNEEKIRLIRGHFAEIMEILGLDLTDESLSGTPDRVAKMYVQEIFSGLDPRNFPDISFFEDKYQDRDQSNLVCVKTSFTSFCEHHFVPMHGTCHVAYLPSEKLIGLSKIPRIVRYFAKRPQLQERLTAQVADTLSNLLETEDIAVSTRATHFCVVARGVEDCQSDTSTQILRGRFQNDPYRRQFLDQSL